MCAVSPAEKRPLRCRLNQRFPNFLPFRPFFANLLRGLLFVNLLFCGPQLYVILLLSPDSLPIIIINIRIQKEVGLSSKKKKLQHLYYCRDCVTRGSIYRQARVTFHNFTEVNFRDKR